MPNTAPASTKRSMTSARTDRLPSKDWTDPLLWLAPHGRRLAVSAAVLAALAIAMAAAGLDVAALACGVAATTLGFLAGLVRLSDQRRNRSRLRGLKAMLGAVNGDPEPILFTDADGAALAANAAAGSSASPESQLARWSADPGRSVAAMIDEVFRTGRCVREFHHRDAWLRTTVYRSDSASELLIWRFSGLQSVLQGAFERLDVPVVTVTQGSIGLNVAARAALDLDEAARDALPDQLAAAFDHGASRAPLALPNGQSVEAIQLFADENRRAVMLLPAKPMDASVGGVAVAQNFEDIPVALARLDGQGRISGTNRLARSLLGLADGEQREFWEVVEGLGRPVSDWLDDARAGRALGRPEILRATLTPHETFVQIILRRAAGPSQDAGLVAVLSDATELKSLEARFVQSQKMQAIGQLAGGIAHDFNNLLTAISGHCDLLLINRDRYDADYSDLLQIHQNANRAAALVRQLLAFSRKQTLKPEVFRLERLLEDLTHLLTRLVGEKINLSLSHDPDLGAIRADLRQLEQVIMNLVVNARDAMPMGGTIRIETSMRHLETELEHGRARVPAGDYALIRVVDEGVGIPADIVDKIFEPFFTTKRLGEGTGLGLSTAYGIVKQMGGYIFVDSEEGSGTTFSLYFASVPDTDIPADILADKAQPTNGAPKPAPPDEDAAQRSGDAERANPIAKVNDAGAGEIGVESPTDKVVAVGGRGNEIAAPDVSRGLTILLVEDEAPVRAFAARALRLQGFQVFEVQDGEQALEFLEDRTLRIDLFVTDVIMPGIDGPGWVARALEDRPGTPVVFVSGYTEDTLSAALGRIPRSVFLGKPFSLRDLTQTIERQFSH